MKRFVEHDMANINPAFQVRIKDISKLCLYVGIFIYIVLPVFLIIGLILIPIGMSRRSKRIKREGEEHSAYYKSSELALSELNNRLEKYFIGKSKVYWRQEPKAQGTEAFFPSVWESKTSRPEVDLKKVPLYIATCRVYAE